MGLFIIMYAISNIDSIKYKNVASAMGSFFGNSNNISQIVGDKQVVEKPANTLSDELSKLIVDNNYDASVRLEESERGITIHILGDILFAPGNAEIGIDSKNILSKIANVLKKIPNDLRIEGHTDDTPISTFRYPSNWHLSVDRALSTAYFFIKDQDIHPDRVSVVGYSEYKPIASNKEAQTRALNRRVDIVILK
ncbi:MAG: OmpA family protein [Melioribacteraceae bacterium]|nr:OmpA family protein [Melioribacteraceae bacterium]